MPPLAHSTPVLHDQASYGAKFTAGDISRTNDFAAIGKVRFPLDQSGCNRVLPPSSVRGSYLHRLQVDYIIHLAAAISVAESMNDPDK